MIQRIQSVFLFASLCFIAPMFVAPVADIYCKCEDQPFTLSFTLSGFQQEIVSNKESTKDGTIHQNYSIFAFGMLICALTLIIIFMYKKRTIQLRLCIYNMLLLAGLFGIILFVSYNIVDVTPSFRLPVVFPLIAIILHYLAFRGIRRDEFMVRALDRLR